MDASWVRYVPSLMVNGNGDMLTGFNGSSVGNYIGAYYNWRLANGAMLLQPGAVANRRQTGSDVTSREEADLRIECGADPQVLQ